MKIENFHVSTTMIQKGILQLLSAQNQDGGWGGAKAVASTIEETALAVEALAEILLHSTSNICEDKDIQDAVSRGVRWLIEQTNQGTSLTASPIGLYFARLWYFEELYPVIFTLSALHKVQRLYSIK